MKWLFAAAGAIASLIVMANAAEPSIVTSVGNVTNVTGAGHSLQPAMTPDGRYVVFLSHANNLAPNDDLGPGLDVFVRDVQSDTTSLVSVDRFGTGGGDRDSGYTSISTDGRYVLFASDARNLIANDTNDMWDVFLRDLTAGTTALVSVNTNGGVSRTSFARPRPTMSADGRWVVFESPAQDLVADDTNQIVDVFIRDVQNAVTELVSFGAQGVPGGRSHSPSVTSDGRRVAFISSAGNLVAERTNRNGDVYVRDLQARETYWASSNLVAHFNNGSDGFRCFNPVISSAGEYVVFKAAMFATSAVHVFYHDIEAGRTEVIATNSRPDTACGLSADGRWLAFDENDAVYLRDLANGTNVLVSVSVSGAGEANGKALRPVVTPNGSHVAFVSSATDLVATTPSGVTNISRVYIRDVAAGVTRLVGVATNGQASESAMEHVLAAISDDGRMVGFDSDADDLVGNDYNTAYDVFVRDVMGGTTELVSVRDEGRPARTGLQSATISRWSLDAAARRIAFSAYDDKTRVPHDTNAMADVFVRDLETGALLPQSESNGVFAAWTAGSQPVISGDGESVLYRREHRTANLYTGANSYDIIWRRIDSGPELVIRTNRVLPEREEPFWRAAISANGALVAYVAHPLGTLELRDIVAGTNRVISNVGSETNPEFSPDDQWLLFVQGQKLQAAHLESNRTVLIATNGSPTKRWSFAGSGRYLGFGTTFAGILYRFDFETTNTDVICTYCREPSLNYDGNLIAVIAENPGSRGDIHVVNMTSGATTLISRDYAGNGRGNGASSSPVISRDGRYVVFVSKASNLVVNDSNGAADIFVHDRLQGTTMMVTRNRQGTGSGNALSSTPVLSADGRTVVFQSFAGDLVEGDYNERRDIFVLRLGVGDSDSDGIDDDWEVAYFGNLARNGAGDFDADGQSDRQEFVSGTDPTDGGSVLRVLTVSPVGGGNTTVVWSAVPGQRYVVQYKDSLEAPNWSNASGVLTATGNSEAFVHGSSAARRYYRVIAVQ